MVFDFFWMKLRKRALVKIDKNLKINEKIPKISFGDDNVVEVLSSS